MGLGDEAGGRGSTRRLFRSPTLAPLTQFRLEGHPPLLLLLQLGQADPLLIGQGAAGLPVLADLVTGCVFGAVPSWVGIVPDVLPHTIEEATKPAV